MSELAVMALQVAAVCVIAPLVAWGWVVAVCWYADRRGR